MRIRALLPAAVGTLLLAIPAGAAAQEEDYVPGLPAAGQAAQAPAPAGSETAPVPAQALVDSGEEAEAAQTDTEAEQQEPGPAEPQGDSDGVPQQYTDPLAGQNEDDGQDGPAAGTSAPAATGVQSVSAAGQLPSTGATSGLLVLAGVALLAAGAALRLLSRQSAYPYPYRRY